MTELSEIKQEVKKKSISLRSWEQKKTITENFPNPKHSSSTKCFTSSQLAGIPYLTSFYNFQNLIY